MWITILTSAAVGALISAGIAFIDRHLERRARRKELLLVKAIDLAYRRTDTIMKIADKNRQGAALRDDVSLAADYFSYLNHLLDHGVLPEGFKTHEAKEERKIGLKDPGKSP